MGVFSVLNSGIIQPLAPAAVLVVFLGIDCAILGVSSGDIIWTVVKAVVYGILFAMSVIWYRTMSASDRVELDGFVLRPEKAKKIQYVRGIPALSGEVVPGTPTGASKGAWPPAEDLGWSPYHSLGFGKPKGRDTQHFWSRGFSGGFNIRSLGYKSSKAKQPSGYSLYECVGVDMVRSNKLITHVASTNPIFKETLNTTSTKSPPIPKEWMRGFQYTDSVQWDPAWNIPRMIVINIQLPYSSPSLWAPQSPDSDPGFSIISYHVVSPTLVSALSKNPDVSQIPTLTLMQRLISEGKSAKETTALKVIGMVSNMEEATFPDMIKGYNGKPVLVTKSGQIHTVGGANGVEILDIEFDVRQWSILARKSLHSLHQKLQEVKCQVGLLIEGKTDAELPEQIFACFGVNYLNILEAVHVEG